MTLAEQTRRPVGLREEPDVVKLIFRAWHVGAQQDKGFSWSAQDLNSETCCSSQEIPAAGMCRRVGVPFARIADRGLGY